MWQTLLEGIGYLMLVANLVHAIWMMKRVFPVDQDNDSVFCTPFNIGMAAAILTAFPFSFMAPFRPLISGWFPVFIALGSVIFHLIYNTPILSRAAKHHEFRHGVRSFWMF
ncbi:MAG: hypothetical protein HY567_00570 [Candidatus Kerfeldbacteria bacterium]|nr:hypothetical protein [Candidatus Kerfeldbacteria bacterium]